MSTLIQPSLTILHSDSDFLFIHKPAGTPFHSEDSVEGFVSCVRAAYPSETLYPVHRLDKVTSGVMVFARNQIANRKLSILFEQRKVQKVYLALSDAKPKKKQGWVKGDIVKARGGSYKMLRSSENPAITRFYSQRLQKNEGLSVFVLAPKTGKTHQLRVAMKSLGSPILGDKRYKGSEHARACLHAYGIQFALDGKDYAVVDKVLEDDLFSVVIDSSECCRWIASCGGEWLNSIIGSDN